MAESKTERLKRELAKQMLGQEMDAAFEEEGLSTEETEPIIVGATGSASVGPENLALEAGSPSRPQPASACLSPPASSSVCPSLTDSDLLILVRDYLDREIHVKERLWTGAGAKDLNKLKKVEGKIPADLVDEIRALRGPVTHHLERAVRLYLSVLNAQKQHQ